MSFYGSAYYWFAILIIGVIAITIWCWRCHKQAQQQQEEVITRNTLHLVQLQIQQQEAQVAQPSHYRPDAPPAYDDVINKPDEYPVYHEGSTITSLTLPSSPEYSSTLDETQQLPPYEEAVRSPTFLMGDTSFVLPERPINADQVESRTVE